MAIAFAWEIVKDEFLRHFHVDCYSSTLLLRVSFYQIRSDMYDSLEI